MPEYQHPGVYIEETSFRGKPIEGVSTSTAGFVGSAPTGPEAVPFLVTSFPQFVREFGPPYARPSAAHGEFLGHAVRGFFDNGGRRAYIVRVLHDSALASSAQASRGLLWRLRRNEVLSPGPGRDVLRLDSLRGIEEGTELQIFTRSGPTGVFRQIGAFGVGALQAQTGAVRLARALPDVELLHWQHTYILDSSSPPEEPPVVPTMSFPTFLARHRGIAGDRLSVRFSPRDRPAVALRPVVYRRSGDTPEGSELALDRTDGLSTEDELAVFDANGFRGSITIEGIVGNTIELAGSPVVPSEWTHLELLRATETASGRSATIFRVANTASFYTGAIVEVDRVSRPSAASAKQIVTVLEVDPEARTVTTTDAGGSVVIAADPQQRRSFLRVLELDIDVAENGAVRESFTGLNWNPGLTTTQAAYARHYARTLNDPVAGSRLVEVLEPQDADADAGLGFQPTTPDGLALSLRGGDDGAPPERAHLIGRDRGPEDRTGIQALMAREDVSIVAVPGVTDEFVQAALLTHCERMRYRFALLDGAERDGSVAPIESQRQQYDSKHGAMYAPWVQVLDPGSGAPLWVPPSGHVAGVYARVDNERGVHKAPANEVIRNVTSLRFAFTDGEQDVLNPAGVNLSREFPGRGIRIWGARTISSDQEWKYVNVRRLFLFLEHSIDRGTQWVVFEPNNEALWDRVRVTIESFLFGVWTTGALMGTRTEEAYFVKCDRSTMSQDDIDNGRLVVLIGVAPTKPAEFVIFRIGQFTASSTQS